MNGDADLVEPIAEAPPPVRQMNLIQDQPRGDDMNKRSKNGLSRRSVLRGGGVAVAGVIAAPFIWGGNRARADTSLTITAWGGTYREAIEKAYVIPFTEETGIAVTVIDNADLAKVKAQVVTNNVQWDVFEGLGPQVVAGAQEDLWERFDQSILDNTDLMWPAGQYEVGHCIATNGVTWDEGRHASGEHPTDFSSFWDTEKFPGRRGLRARPSETFEMALVADGVPISELYPLDIERAFRALDRIKPHVRSFIEQSHQMVTMVERNEIDFGYSGANRIVAARRAGSSIEVSLSQTINTLQYYSIVNGTRNREAAMRYVSFSLRPDRQAALTNELSFVPNSKKGLELASPEAQKYMPDLDSPNNIMLNDAWWADNFVDLHRRFIEWTLS